MRLSTHSMLNVINRFSPILLRSLLQFHIAAKRVLHTQVSSPHYCEIHHFSLHSKNHCFSRKSHIFLEELQKLVVTNST